MDADSVFSTLASSLGSGASVGGLVLFFIKRELKRFDALAEAANQCRLQNAETFATKEDLRNTSDKVDRLADGLAELRGRLAR